MKGIISVIVPVYNIREYLREAVDSVLKQDYQKLQVILIDDGSTDDSGKICDEYAQRDNRISVIHQKNGGAASAKNTGLKVAEGEYLAFLDSDDYLEEGAYSYMVKQLEDNKADAIQCCFRDIYVNESKERILFEGELEYDTMSYLKLYTQEWSCGLMTDKLYRRKLFDGIFFEEGHKIDDEYFTYRGMMNAKKILRRPIVVYNYRRRKSSVMLSESSQKQIVLDKLDYLSKRRVRVAERFPELKKDFDEHYLNSLILLSKDPYVSQESLEKIKQLINSYFREKKHVKISFGLIWKLVVLKYKSIIKLLKEKREPEKIQAGKEYYM